MKRFYFVACDTVLPNGGTLLDDRLSRQIERISILRRVLKRVRRTIPQAFAVSVKRYRQTSFAPASPARRKAGTFTRLLGFLFEATP